MEFLEGGKGKGESRFDHRPFDMTREKHKPGRAQQDVVQYLQALSVITEGVSVRD